MLISKYLAVRNQVNVTTGNTTVNLPETKETAGESFAEALRSQIN